MEMIAEQCFLGAANRYRKQKTIAVVISLKIRSGNTDGKTQREREREREGERERDRETDRQTDRQTETDRDRQRQTETDRDSRLLSSGWETCLHAATAR